MIPLIGVGGKAFDGVRALAGVSMEFPASGCAAIIGPNGAGKSTLLNSLTGFVRPDAGACFLRGEEITGLPVHDIVRRGVARTFQNVRLIDGLSVLDNVMLARPDQSGERLWKCIWRTGVGVEELDNLGRPDNCWNAWAWV